MKKIGIVTIHNSPNYGACLQAFALYEYIRQCGADCEIIDVHRPVHKDYVYERKYKSYRNNPFTLRKKARKVVAHLLGRSPTSEFFSPVARLRFEDFNRQIKYSQVYNKLSALEKDPPLYDVYISGSDQLWNPAQPYCLKPYFLTFAPQGSVKISYATSIGLTELSLKEKLDFKKYLETYSAISVRETQAKELLDSFMEGKDVVRVADPTFLLDVDYWKDIAVCPGVSGKYMAVFLLQRNESLVNYALQLSKESGMKLVLLKNRGVARDGVLVDNDLGPKEFLGYLAGASMVLTDSFHCTVFSLLMGAENFYTYISPTSKRGSRIVDLLHTFSLENHLLPIDFSSSYATLAAQGIDRDSILRIVNQEKKRSREFLDKWIR